MVRLIRFLWLMQLISRAVRLVFPWIRRVIVHMVVLTCITVIAFWGGVPRTARNIADDWLDRAVLQGFPTKYDKQMYYVFYSLAFGMIIFGWVAMSFLTVFVVRLIFF